MKATILFSCLTLFTFFSACTPDYLENMVSENNKTDKLTVDVVNMDDFTDTLTYTYTCTNDNNLVVLTSAVTDGSVQVQISDANGNNIYNRTLNNISNFSNSVTAPAGLWTLTLISNDARGTVTTVLKKE